MSNRNTHIRKHGKDSYLGKKLRKKTEKILLDSPIINGRIHAIRHIENSTSLNHKECRKLATTFEKRLIQCGRLILEESILV